MEFDIEQYGRSQDFKIGEKKLPRCIVQIIHVQGCQLQTAGASVLDIFYFNTYRQITVRLERWLANDNVRILEF